MVISTIKDREGKTRRASYEILNTVEDYRAHRVGGFRTALFLGESCVIPSLLSNSPCLYGMVKEEERVVNECQDFFLRLILATGPGATKVALGADTATQSVVYMLYKDKILLIQHLIRLEDTALAKLM